MRPFTFLVNGGTIEDVGVREDETGIEAGDAAVIPYLPRITLEWLLDAPGERHRTLDGTMAFVDVSGFTAMSERLAPKGRLGAEEVTDVMSATFGRLLSVSAEGWSSSAATRSCSSSTAKTTRRVPVRPPGACVTRSPCSARSRPRSARSS
jgi:hypothetical protein